MLAAARGSPALGASPPAGRIIHSPFPLVPPGPFSGQRWRFSRGMGPVASRCVGRSQRRAVGLSGGPRGQQHPAPGAGWAGALLRAAFLRTL